jgi:eukaryotic-like serine/threonine-protein kinase
VTDSDLVGTGTGDDTTERLIEPLTERLSARPAEAVSEHLVADRYLLRTEIGRGGMGVVWRADDRVIGRQVAVKEMRLATDVGPDTRAEYEERILREARTAGRLNDPAVVTVFDVVHDDGSIFIVMELVEAPTLSALVRERGPLEPDLVAEIGRQVLTALEAAHAAGVVHRDVKPSNIMVLPSGRPKLTDFGIAQAADDPTLTKTGMVVGSPAYLAPERLSGREATPASDIWALGAVLFFAVEGKGAFERETTAATLNAVINDVPYLTRGQGPLAAAVSGMLAPSPEGRLTAVQLRPLLNAAANPYTRETPDRTMVIPGNGQLTRAFSVPPNSGVDGDPSRGRGSVPKRTRKVIFGGSLTLAVLLAAATAHLGFDLGESHQKTADAKNYAALDYTAVATYSLGGSAAELPNFSFGYGTCGTGQIPLSATAPYSFGSCSDPHSVEVYYKDSLVDSTFSKFGTDGNATPPFPGEQALRTLGQNLCWTDRWLSKTTDLTGGKYKYAALIPSKDLWTGNNLPTGRNADQTVYCVMWSAGPGGLPAD